MLNQRLGVGYYWINMKKGTHTGTGLPIPAYFDVKCIYLTLYGGGVTCRIMKGVPTIEAITRRKRENVRRGVWAGNSQVLRSKL